MIAEVKEVISNRIAKVDGCLVDDPVATGEKSCTVKVLLTAKADQNTSLATALNRKAISVISAVHEMTEECRWCNVSEVKMQPIEGEELTLEVLIKSSRVEQSQEPAQEEVDA